MQHKSLKPALCHGRFVQWEMRCWFSWKPVFSLSKCFNSEFMTRLSQGSCSAQLWQKLDASAFWQWLGCSCKSLVLFRLDPTKCSVSWLWLRTHLGCRGESQRCEGPRCGFWNCPDNVPSLGLSDCLNLQISWTYGLCYCASLGWFSPEPMFSHHHFSVIWETLFAMETNICWARDADSGPVGLCSYSWVCVRAVRDSWLMYLVLSLVRYCGVQSCVWLLTCQRGRRSEGKQGMACAPVGFVCCPTASPTTSVCAWWALAVRRGNVGIK